METIDIAKSVSLADACTGLLGDVRVWIDSCIESYADEPAIDCHDQGTFTTSWVCTARRLGHSACVAFMTQLRDKTRAHHVDAGHWRHGYWRMQEAHHGTEHFELFLGALNRLAPEDEETVRQLVDAAEHIGNWVPEVPAWFDWESGLFRSMHFGADGVKLDCGERLNVPDHLRFVNIALSAYRMTSTERYLDLSIRHAGLWADSLAPAEPIPVGLADAGAVRTFGGEQLGRYRSFAGQAPDCVEDVDRAENLLASGAVECFLTLWSLTGQERFRRGAERILDVLATQLTDPDAGSAADVIRTYRRQTGDQRYDAAVLGAARDCGLGAVRTLSLEPVVPREKRASGIGKRKDIPDWFEDGTLRRWHPVTIAVAAEVGGDEVLATAAVDVARAYLALARRVYPDGRTHGCSARSVNAIARGHGRENGAGVVTGVLDPLCELALGT